MLIKKWKVYLAWREKNTGLTPAGVIVPLLAHCYGNIYRLSLIQRNLYRITTFIHMSVYAKGI